MTSTTNDELRIAEIPTGVTVDPVTLDIIEGALKNARFEMDAVLFRSAMSPVIREQHDEFPMLTDPRGRMVVGQFGAYINEMMADWDRGVYPGDVILTSDPFKCSGSISHTNDWLVLLPIFYEDELVGWSSQFGHMMDAGGPLPGRCRPVRARSSRRASTSRRSRSSSAGWCRRTCCGVILNNVRLPEMNRADLFAIVAGCRAGERRVLDLCERFGKETYLAALQALLDRTYEAMKFLISVAIPEEPQTFVDYIDDDGLGNGPFKMQLTIWREGEHAFFDWSGTDPQAMGPINFYLSEGMFKMFIGIYLIMVNDPQILFNDGFYPLLHVVMPEGCLLKPRYPAALGCRTHALARQFDVLGGALCKNAPELNTAAGYGTSPVHALLGLGRQRGLLLLDGDPLRRHPGTADRRRDGRPLVVAALREHPDRVPRGLLPDADRRLHDDHGLRRRRAPSRRQRRREALRLPRAGRGLDPRRPLADAARGACSAASRASAPRRSCAAPTAREERLPSKCDNVVVEPGDMLVYRTAGGGGWKDRLDRPAEAVARDVELGLVSREKALASYGVVVADDGSVDAAATEQERERQRAERGEALAFDFGPPLAEALANVHGGDGARAADAGEAAALVAARGRGRDPRPRPRAGGGVAVSGQQFEGFGQRGGGVGRRPALVDHRHEQRLHRPGLAARVRARRHDRGDPEAARGGAARGDPGRLHDRLVRRGRQGRPRRRSSRRCRRCSRSRRARAGSRSTSGSRRGRTSRC